MEIQQGAVPRRLNYLKCIRCRADKKQCLPAARTWPGQKCNRCAQRDYACSQSMTAKQQNMMFPKDPNTSRGKPSTDTSIVNPFRPLQIEPPLHLPVEISQEHVGNGQVGGAFVAPKCAVLFDNLRNSTWNYFGAPQYTFDMRLVDIAALETDAVYDVLRSRRGLLDLLQDYEDAAKEARSRGMAEEESQTFASRKVVMKVGLTTHSIEAKIDDFVQSFDFRIKVARRLKSLLDIIGAQEILLLSFDEDIIEETGDIPIPRFLVESDEEWRAVLCRLLDSRFELRETCLKLSGVVNMIQRLVGLDACDLRSFLASEIKRRTKEVLGSSDDSEGEDDDESMADVE